MGETLSERFKHFGEGLFETFRVENGKLPPYFEYHYERLKKGAEFLNIPYPTFEKFKTFVENEVSFTRKEEGIFATKVLLLSIGDAYFGGLPTDYRLEIRIKKYTPPNKKFILTFSPYRRHSQNPLWRFKTTGGYLFNVAVKREAVSRGFFDALILNEKGHITETSSSNFYCLKDGLLVTPPVEDGLLEGITRRVLLEKGKATEGVIKPEDLKNCDGFYISNSLMGLVRIKLQI